MKKSEFERQLREMCWSPSRIESAIGTATRFAEDAGATWDPEEEPMAEEMVVRENMDRCGGGWRLVVGGDGGRNPTEAEASLAADLYRRREAIAEVAKELRENELPRPLGSHLRCLADRLEGKKEEVHAH